MKKRSEVKGEREGGMGKRRRKKGERSEVREEWEAGVCMGKRRGQEEKVREQVREGCERRTGREQCTWNRRGGIFYTLH